MDQVCSSSSLDRLLSEELRLSFRVPKSRGVDYISERTTGIAIPESDLMVRNMTQYKFRPLFSINGRTCIF